MAGDHVTPLVSVIVPCRNESRDIEACVRSILSQEEPPGGLRFEVIVADGLSDDGTREKVESIARVDSRIRLIDNPARIVSAGLNAGIAAARGTVLIRMDAHTEYAPDYIRQCVAVLAETGADNVGGPWVARGNGYVSRAIAAAFQSPFAAGGSHGHDPAYEGPLDTVYLGCWVRETFSRIGTFDEELVRNQDDELNLRVIRAGGRVWQSPRIRSWYLPRPSLTSLFRQYCQYGYWKVRVIQKHGRPASLRHLVPVLFVTGVAFGGLAGLVHRSLWYAYAGTLTLYGLTAFAFSARAAAASGWALMPLLPVVFVVYHFSYGLGFALGVLDFVVLRRGGRPAMAVVTRPHSVKQI